MIDKPQWCIASPQQPTAPSDLRDTDTLATNTEEKPGHHDLLHWLEQARLDDRKWLLRLLHSTLDPVKLSQFHHTIIAEIHDLKNKPALSQQAAHQLRAFVNQMTELYRVSLDATPHVHFIDLIDQPNLDHAAGLKNKEVYQRLLDFLRLFIRQTEMNNGQNTVGQPVLRPQTQAELDQVKQHLLKLGYEENWVEVVECNQACRHPLEALADCLIQLGSLFADLILTSKTALEQQLEEEHRNQLNYITPSPSPSGSSKRSSKKKNQYGRKK